jgi:hypothetical protein
MVRSERLIGSLADTLRSVGRIVEARQGSRVEVIGGASLLVVYWRDSADARHQHRYYPAELARLRADSRTLRGIGLDTDVGTGVSSGAAALTAHLAEFFRQLGQDLDAFRAEAVGIVQCPDGLFVTASSPDGHLLRTYSVAELRRLCGQQRQARRPEPRLGP